MADPPLQPQAMVCVTVCASLRPGEVNEWSLQLPAGATVADALQACGLAQPGALVGLAVGIWGRALPASDHALRLLADGDRVECCRALTVDPKLARRQRFASQGARTAGLFANRRTGGKQGY